MGEVYTLKQFILSAVKFIRVDDLSHGMHLNSETLEFLLPQLKQTEEFKNCNIHFMGSPVIHTSATTVHSQTLKFIEGTKFTGDVYLYAIALSPLIFDWNSIPEINEDIFITPTIYDSTTFAPHRYICVKFSPEQSQDVRAMQSNVNEDLNQKELIDNFTNFVRNLKPKTPLGYRYVMLRGYFPNLVTPDEAKSMVIDNRDLENQAPMV